MKTSLNLANENSVPANAKLLLKLGKKIDIIDMVEKLPKPDIEADADLKALYYHDKAKKYGL